MTSNRVSLESDDARQLVVDLSKAPGRIQRNASKGIRKSARLVEKQMRVDATGHQGNWFGKPGTAYNTPLEKHVSSEMTGLLSAEIGIENKGAGKLAHIIVFGSVNNAPVYDHTAALRRSVPEIEQIMGAAAESAVFGKDGK